MTDFAPDTLIRIALPIAIAAPIVSSVVVGLTIVGRAKDPGERGVASLLEAGLAISFLASAMSALLVAGAFGPATSVVHDYGAWLALGRYEIPIVLLADGPGTGFSMLAAGLTLLVARFSRTYMLKEPGFNRFFVLLGWFASGAQLVAFAGALDIFFAGWELIGISSALFIGFFYERDEPVRSSMRAFATYRLCDAGFLMAMVSTHELLGSTHLSALDDSARLPLWQSTAIGLCFLLSVMGKSAQLPFSGWLPRAMEGPTPSSALFYGGVSLHAGLFLMLRISPVVAVSPIVQTVGVLVGVSTAIYASAVARTHTDAKGALAHATLSQVGLILAEISLGLTNLALIHIACHAMLRVWQYLRAPSALHDAHRTADAGRAVPPSANPSAAERRTYAAALHRLRVDDRIDALAEPVLGLARWIDGVDRRFRRLLRRDGQASG